MKAINKQDLINYLKKSPENLNFNIFGTMLEDFRNTYETDEQIVDKIKNIITNIIEGGGSISPEDDTITELVDLITELLPEKMIIKPVGTLEITENGEYDVLNKAGVNIQVPLPSGTISITQNGTANVNDYEYANVSVIDPLGEFVKSNVTNFEIPEGVITIGRETFKNYTNLEEITIPDSVTTIEDQAFSNCSNLVTINNGTKINSIASSAFSNCPSNLITRQNGNYYEYALYNHKLTLKTVGGSMGDPSINSTTKASIYTIILDSKGVGSLDIHWFDNDYSNLINLIIGKNLTDIEISGAAGAPFQNSNIESITVDKDNPYLDSRNNCNAIINEYGTLIRGCKNTQIPNDIKAIGNHAFSNCTGLTSVTIPNSVTYISNNTFSNCTGLTSVTIPDSVTNIYDSAFSGCTGLTSVNIPNSMTSIRGWAFYGCTGLTDVYYTGTQEEWNSITIGSNNTPLTNATIHYNYTPSN